MKEGAPTHRTSTRRRAADRAPTSVAANGPAPSSAASLYLGEVMHQRLKPAAHRFTYRVCTVLLDVDRLEEAARQSRLFSIDRPNLVSVHQRDHGPRDGSPLRDHLRTVVAQAAPDLAIGRILMLAYPRVFGNVFNPITVYFVEAAGAEPGAPPAAIVYEVRNTFGGMHSYVLPVAAGEASPAGVRQSQSKDFFVSPFIEMAQTYDFRVLPPGEAVRVRILERDREGPILSATFAGRHEPLTTRSLLAAFGRGQLMPFKVLAAIHWEAVRLLLKGIRGLTIPKTAKRTTVGVRHAASDTGAPIAPLLERDTGRRPA